jgi:hypothetical protein
MMKIPRIRLAVIVTHIVPKSHVQKSRPNGTALVTAAEKHAALFVPDFARKPFSGREQPGTPAQKPDQDIQPAHDPYQIPLTDGRNENHADASHRYGERGYQR